MRLDVEKYEYSVTPPRLHNHLILFYVTPPLVLTVLRDATTLLTLSVLYVH